MKNNIEINVRFNEQDEMGIVHNSVYYIWFEIARINFASNILDISYEELKKMGIQSPVVYSDCKYIKPAKFPDKLEINCYYVPTEKNMLILRYEVIRKNTGELLAIGRTENVFIDRQGRLLVQRPDFLQRAIKCVYESEELIWIEGR